MFFMVLFFLCVFVFFLLVGLASHPENPKHRHGCTSIVRVHEDLLCQNERWTNRASPFTDARDPSALRSA